MNAVNLDAERAYVGALLALSCNGVTELAAAVRGPDLSDPGLRDILAAVVHVAELGVDPLPVAVLNRMVVNGYGEAHRFRILGDALSRLYLEAPPAVSAPYYAGLVVEQAYRRAMTEMCERLTQAVSVSGLADLGALLLAEVERVMGVWSRIPEKVRVAS